MNIYRHGDVLLKQVKELPKKVKKLKTNVLAYGEQTGHSHQVIARLETMTIYEAVEGKFLELTAPAKVKHQEHSTIELLPGIYKIGIEEEYDPFSKAIRQVQD